MVPFEINVHNGFRYTQLWLFPTTVGWEFSIALLTCNMHVRVVLFMFMRPGTDGKSRTAGV